MQSDEELMLKYINGDYAAFEEIYQRYKGRVLAFITSKVGADKAQDIHQKVFLKLHEKRQLYKTEYPFAPWFFTLIRNTINDHFRKQKVTHVEFSEEYMQDKEENNEEVDLPEIDRKKYELLFLKFVEGYKYGELEEMFNVKSSTLRKRVSRLLDSLRKNL